ncbi:MAG: alpha/beta fold hydrolase [Gemmatimonadetes bacterium]|nr:alpha/beta fold hydrolase [Gemmatimonadota bacterium]MBT8405615.1 alpha/beta fold hydrolase [Gemmatimonadota bacterium]NNF37520.1 alpha/beta fold hydrolase [Gemmatimonadota bacterium]
MPREPFTPDPRLFPFERHWFEHPAGPVHYVDEGEGPPILFLHGNPTWSFLYRGIVIRLRKRFRCIAPDYPGFGLSARPSNYGYSPAEHAGVIRDLVRHLDLAGLTVMGQDWGGPIGLRVAADERPRLRALVMGNTWFWPAEGRPMNAFGYVMASAPAQSLLRKRNLFVDRLMPLGVLHRLAPEVMRQYRDAQSEALGREGIAEFSRHVTASRPWLENLEDDVERTLADVPLLLTWGTRDPLFPPSTMDRFRLVFDDVTIARLEAKHFIQEDAPAEIAEAIEDFLAPDPTT